MELILNNTQIIPKEEVVTAVSKGNFIEANTEKVSLNHLQKKCTIPVFAKDNETTISHYQFINEASNAVKKMFPEMEATNPQSLETTLPLVSLIHLRRVMCKNTCFPRIGKS
jgi:hypothetical protein